MLVLGLLERQRLEGLLTLGLVHSDQLVEAQDAVQGVQRSEARRYRRGRRLLSLGISLDLGLRLLLRLGREPDLSSSSGSNPRTTEIFIASSSGR